ncbi:DUF3570 domain-containing protein [Thiogranum longum]
MVAISRSKHLLFAALLLVESIARAGVLPEDRADAMYHSYDGGGVEVTGPSYLVRKGDNKRFSASANYYVDTITSASIDVVTQGSPYDEERTQISAGIDYLHADTTMSLSYSNSDESDYDADTYNFSVSQSMFGDLTTITLGYSRGFDDIFSNVDSDFKDTADHQNYHISLSQVLTKSLILSLNYDAITDEGYLQNPYRNVLVLNDPTDPSLGFNFNTPERYPNTRTSNAISANFMYYLPYRAAVKAGYRYYDDDWDISAHTVEVGYIHPLWDKWTFEVNYRYYTQTDAEFYGDVFARPDEQNFVARDKELSEFEDHTLGFAISYDVLDKSWGYVDKATLNFKYHHIWFEYDNFTDVTDSSFPAYEFDADVFQIFGSIWY